MDKITLIQTLEKKLAITTQEAEQVSKWIQYRMGNSIEQTDVSHPSHFEYDVNEISQKKDHTRVSCLVISVDCERNDPVDIRCGGPDYLGYDFKIEYDRKDEFQRFIKEQIKASGGPFIRFSEGTKGTSERHELWTKTDIAMEIHNGYNSVKKKSYSLGIGDQLILKTS